MSEEVIRRFRAAGYWLFGVFDALENLVALYRVDAANMAPHIALLEDRMMKRQGNDQALENNPKFTLDRLRPGATRLFLHAGYVEDEIASGKWRINRADISPAP